MGGLSNLVLRGRVFYFRRRVPIDLRDRLGRRELVRSLGTIDPMGCAAKRLSAISCFGRPVHRPARDSDADRRRTLPSRAGFLRDRAAGRRCGTARAGRTAALAPHGDQARFYGKVAARAREALASDGFGEAREIAASLLRRQGIATATFGVAEWNQGRQAVLKAGIDAAEAMQARCAGNFEHEPKDRRLKVALAALASEPAPASTPAAPATATSSEPDKEAGLGCGSYAKKTVVSPSAHDPAGAQSERLPTHRRYSADASSAIGRMPPSG